MGSQAMAVRGLRVGALLAALSGHPAPASADEAGFVTLVEKLRAGQALTTDEAALYSTELQRLVGKLADRQPLTPQEQAELHALGQPRRDPAPPAGGTGP